MLKKNDMNLYGEKKNSHLYNDGTTRYVFLCLALFYMKTNPTQSFQHFKNCIKL